MDDITYQFVTEFIHILDKSNYGYIGRGKWDSIHLQDESPEFKKWAIGCLTRIVPDLNPEKLRIEYYEYRLKLYVELNAPVCLIEPIKEQLEKAKIRVRGRQGYFNTLLKICKK